MKLDHISYAVSHNQIVDVIQRLGAALSGTFLDGGIHPRFGTRNFILPLKNDMYLEVICPLEHPVSEMSPFRKFVTQKIVKGEGWLGWALSVEDIELMEIKLARKAIEAHRKKPDGVELEWRQIGILDALADSQLPFFVEWKNSEHPSSVGTAQCSIKEIVIAGDENVLIDWMGLEIERVLGDIKLNYINSKLNYGENGITSVLFDTPNGEIRIE